MAMPAFAAPPTLTSTSHVKRHPRASWTLPFGVDSATIEVATSPEAGTDGSFFHEHVVEFDVLEPRQTNWLSSDTRLKAGRYYVHISGYEESCAYVTCPGRQWSNSLILDVRNQPPRISKLRYWLSGKYLVEAHATFTACDDLAASGRVTVHQRHWLTGRPLRVTHAHSVSLSRAGCSRVTVDWYPARRLFGVGWHLIRLRFRDSEGGLSNVLSRRWYVVD